MNATLPTTAHATTAKAVVMNNINNQLANNATTITSENMTSITSNNNNMTMENVARNSNSTATPTSTFPPNDLDVIQGMIDISADRLVALRTQCATSVSLTQQEIRSLEAKLVRMFTELLLTKARLNERIPANGLPNTTGNELKQWLRVVGLSQESVNVCLTRLSTLEQLLEQHDDELKQMLSNNPSYREEELRRLTKAIENLRKCKIILSSGNGSHDVDKDYQTNLELTDSKKERLIEDLYWDSFDRHQHHHNHHRGSIGNMTASPRTHRMLANKLKQQTAGGSNRQSPAHHVEDAMASSIQSSTLTLTLTPSPPNTPLTPNSISNLSSACSAVAGAGSDSVGAGSLNGTPQRSKPAGTPPPMKKHQTMLPGMQMTPTHSSNIHHHQQQEDTNGINSKVKLSDNSSSTQPKPYTIPNTRSRVHTDPSPDSYSSSQSSAEILMDKHGNSNNLQVPPRSPCTPIVTLGMGHTITHRFTKVFKMMSTCDLCLKPMFFGLKCRECKFRCHKDCEGHVPPSCGLPPEFVDEFKKTLNDQAGFNAMAHAQSSVNTSPNLSTLSSKNRGVRRNKSGSTIGSIQPDSSSPGSSCNSSTPSSPALMGNLHQHQLHQSTPGNSSGNIMSSSGGGSSSTSSNMQSTPSSYHKHTSQFNFPDVTITSNYNNQTTGGGTTQTLYSSQTNTMDMSHADCSMSPQDYLDSANLNRSNAADNLKNGNINNASLISSSTSSNVTITASMGSSNQHSLTSSLASSVIPAAGPSTFYPRKLSSAGVDKRVPFSAELSDTHKSNDSDKTVSLSGSTSASTDSDRTPVRLDSTEDGDSGNWPRQNSLSFKEWDIPYGDLRLLEQIGRGRFGTVHRALWHGDVAVKLLKEDYLDDEHMLEAFKLEVANFKKTRHENLVLFMGACMNPPYLAIVTSLCKGNTLYTYIHARRDKFTINKTTLVAQQISQGMGYLHARGIFHKDLRTKNIFLENGKVIITDFGLFSSAKLLYCSVGLGVPCGWLCYLSPELMRALMPIKPTDEILPFSKASDVYSFGTVWYELLCGEFPFKLQPPESIIWQVGRGMKQTLANLQTSRDVKEILMLCWSFQADDRPDFPKLLTLLERLPKKRLARSPSHPVQLSRSAESVF